MALQIRWLGTACFEVQLPDGKTLVTDPYMDDSVSAPFGSDQIRNCDYIFITHGHFDHVLDVGKLAERFEPKIYCNQETVEPMIQHQNVPENLLKAATVGDVIEEEGLRAEVVKGQHVDFEREFKRLAAQLSDEEGASKPISSEDIVKKLFQGAKQPEKLDEWMRNYPQGEQLNFVFKITGGKRIYMAGSYPFPDIIDVAHQVKADIALLQVMSGELLKGLEDETARFAMATGCKTVIPQHHDPLFEGGTHADLAQLKRIISEKSDIDFKELIPGQWYEF